jgi:hypothetical protein
MADYNDPVVARFIRLGFTGMEVDTLKLVKQFLYAIPAFNLSICEYSDPQTKLSFIMPDKIPSERVSPIELFLNVKAFMAVCNDQIRANPGAPINENIRKTFVALVKFTDWPPTKWVDFINSIKKEVGSFRVNPVFHNPGRLLQKDADVARLLAQLKDLAEISLSCDTFSLIDKDFFNKSSYEKIYLGISAKIFRDYFLSKAHYSLDFMSRLTAALTEIIRIIERNSRGQSIEIQTAPIADRRAELGFWDVLSSFFDSRPEIIPFRIPSRNSPARVVSATPPAKAEAVEKVIHEHVEKDTEWTLKFVNEIAAIGATSGQLNSKYTYELMEFFNRVVSEDDLAFSIFKHLSADFSAEQFKDFMSVINTILQFDWNLAFGVQGENDPRNMDPKEDIEFQRKLFNLKPEKLAQDFSRRMTDYFIRYLEANLKLKTGRDIQEKLDIIHGTQGDKHGPSSKDTDEAYEKMFS